MIRKSNPFASLCPSHPLLIFPLKIPFLPFPQASQLGSIRSVCVFIFAKKGAGVPAATYEWKRIFGRYPLVDRLPVQEPLEHEPLFRLVHLVLAVQDQRVRILGALVQQVRGGHFEAGYLHRRHCKLCGKMEKKKRVSKKNGWINCFPQTTSRKQKDGLRTPSGACLHFFPICRVLSIKPPVRTWGQKTVPNVAFNRRIWCPYRDGIT